MDSNLDSSKKRLKELDEQITEKLENKKLLNDLERQSITSYDKTLVTLSSGALGISFAFVGNFIPNDKIVSPEILIYAWGCWAASLAVVLSSFLSSHLSMRTGMEQENKLINELKKEKKCIENGEDFKRVDSSKGNKEKFSDWLDSLTGFLNILSGIAFVGGLAFIFCFVKLNLK